MFLVPPPCPILRRRFTLQLPNQLPQVVLSRLVVQVPQTHHLRPVLNPLQGLRVRFDYKNGHDEQTGQHQHERGHEDVDQRQSPCAHRLLCTVHRILLLRRHHHRVRCIIADVVVVLCSCSVRRLHSDPRVRQIRKSTLGRRVLEGVPERVIIRQQFVGRFMRLVANLLGNGLQEQRNSRSIHCSRCIVHHRDVTDQAAVPVRLRHGRPGQTAVPDLGQVSLGTGRCRRHTVRFPFARTAVRQALLQRTDALAQYLTLCPATVPELGPGKESPATHHVRIATVWKGEEQHLFDGTTPHVATGCSSGALEADSVLFLEEEGEFKMSWICIYPAHFTHRLSTGIRVTEVCDEHLSLVIQLVHLRPAEVLCPLAGSECTNATVVNSQVQLRSPMILHRMRINAVRLQAPGDCHKLIVDGA